MSPPPPPAQAPVTATEDEEHLRLLTLFHYVLAGLLTLFSLFPIFHLGFGAAMLFLPEKFTQASGDAAMTRIMGAFFVCFALLFMGCGLALALSTAWSGRLISRRHHHTFSLVIAALLCFFMPFGTVLGVFTLIVLTRPSVKALYRSGHTAP